MYQNTDIVKSSSNHISSHPAYITSSNINYITDVQHFNKNKQNKTFLHEHIIQLIHITNLSTYTHITRKIDDSTRALLNS